MLPATTIEATRLANPLQLLTRGEDEPAVETTLLELVRAVGEITEDDQEIIATVCHLLQSGRVRLVGNFRGTVPDAA